jgi:hypothetical protein
MTMATMGQALAGVPVARPRTAAKARVAASSGPGRRAVKVNAFYGGEGAATVGAHRLSRLSTGVPEHVAASSLDEAAHVDQAQRHCTALHGTARHYRYALRRRMCLLGGTWRRCGHWGGLAQSVRGCDTVVVCVAIFLDVVEASLA